MRELRIKVLAVSLCVILCMTGIGLFLSSSVQNDFSASNSPELGFVVRPTESLVDIDTAIIEKQWSTASTEHDPIFIDGDDDFAEQAENENWLGDGTAKHPFIIEGYHIDVNDADISCIEIRNIVDTYFIIRDCAVTGASGPFAQPIIPFIQARAGIYLCNVQYAEVTNNLVFGNCYGVRLDDAYDVLVSHNTCHSNNWEGIVLLFDSRLCIVIDNFCFDNIDSIGYLGNGIGCGVGAHDNQIVYNHAYNNEGSGIGFWDGHDNIARENECYGNLDWGFFIRGESSGNEILENDCWDNYHGIYLDNSDSNTISDNTCFLNEAGGIVMLYDSTLNTVTDNECYDNLLNGIGIGLGTINNTIEYNLVYNNGYAGIIIWTGYDTIVRGNDCYDNEYGISLRGESSDNFVCKNECIGNSEAGIHLGESFNNEVSKNTCKHNPIRLDNSYDNTVSNNNLRRRGIGLINSHHNTVIGNDCQRSLRSGIGLFDSYENTIVDNTCSYNPHSGIYLSSSYSNELYGNIFYRNAHGIYLTGCSSNEIYHNSIIENHEQAVDEYPVAESFWYSRTLLEGNYWSNYPGSDDGSNGRVAYDGIGDTDLPWPDEGFDMYPLMDVTVVIRLNLQDLVDEGVMTENDVKPLISKLDAAIALMDRGKLFQASQKLGDFIDQVNALVNSGRLPEEEGNHLISLAQGIIDVLRTM
jgi:parallel beta-helix repeat protein